MLIWLSNALFRGAVALIGSRVMRRHLVNCRYSTWKSAKFGLHHYLTFDLTKKVAEVISSLFLTLFRTKMDYGVQKDMFANAHLCFWIEIEGAAAHHALPLPPPLISCHKRLQPLPNERMHVNIDIFSFCGGWAKPDHYWGIPRLYWGICPSS